MKEGRGVGAGQRLWSWGQWAAGEAALVLPTPSSRLCGCGALGLFRNPQQDEPDNGQQSSSTLATPNKSNARKAWLVVAHGLRELQSCRRRRGLRRGRPPQSGSSACCRPQPVALPTFWVGLLPQLMQPENSYHMPTSLSPRQDRLVSSFSALGGLSFLFLPRKGRVNLQTPSTGDETGVNGDRGGPGERSQCTGVSNVPCLVWDAGRHRTCLFPIACVCMCVYDMLLYNSAGS